MQSKSQIQLLAEALGELNVKAKAPADLATMKEALRQLVLDSYSDAYKELTDNWKTLETKAQGNITVAGVFIAAAFAYTSSTGPKLAEVQQLVLVLAIIFLVISVLLAVHVLRIREVPAPPYGEFVDENVEHLLQEETEDELTDSMVNFANDQKRAWRKVMERMAEDVERKASLLWSAQMFLLAAIVTVVVLALSNVFRRW